MKTGPSSFISPLAVHISLLIQLISEKLEVNRKDGYVFQQRRSRPIHGLRSFHKGFAFFYKKRHFLQVLHMFASVLNLFPLLVSISLWPRVMNPKNPPWITGHLVSYRIFFFSNRCVHSLGDLEISRQLAVTVIVFQAACVVYALLRLVALIGSIYAIIRMKRPSFVKAYIACTWLGVFLDGIGIIISLTIIEYPFSTITTGFMVGIP